MKTQNNVESLLTVVIPTLGGDILEKTIHQLNSGTVIPEEVLVCIPGECAANLNVNQFDNVRVIETPFFGQVAQRAKGFKQAKGKFVIQLDDDIYLDETCIYYLLETLKKHDTNLSVGPVMYDLSTGQSTSLLMNKKWLNHLYYWIINGSLGYIPGAISKSGAGMGANIVPGDKKEYEVEWMPGGCMAHHKENLILDNYYPYKGKAFCEDLIHCKMLSDKGNLLIMDSKARCGVDIPISENLGFRMYLKEHFSGYKARKYFVRFSGNSLYRMNLYYASLTINHVFRLIKNKMSKKL